MGLLAVGAEAPEFETLDQDGRTVRLRDFRGQTVVLFFYPADDTPGCTAEACNFRDDSAGLAELGAVVLGVSTQGVGSHRRFADKYRLNFPLLADPDKQVCRAYRALNLLGFAKRVTYLIGPEGRIAHVWSHVNVKDHPREVRAVVASLRKGSPVPS